MLHIKKGDLVSLTDNVDAIDVVDIDKKKRTYVHRRHDKNVKPPYMIRDATVGVFLGDEYVPAYRSKRVVQKPAYKFIFAGQIVYMDPILAKVEFSYEETNE